jgi:oligopeptide/dipeptide ABC transporter ATP-binding protein
MSHATSQVGGPGLTPADGPLRTNGSLLEVSGLETHFPLGKGWRINREWIRAVDGVDFTLNRGEVLGVVGESGSGKTTVGRSVIRLERPTAGTVHFDGVDILRLPPAAMRAMRRRMQIIFQDPYASLSPRMQIGQILGEALRLHQIVPVPRINDTAAELLARVGLEDYFLYRYPHEMSGGQRQRIMIARPLSLGPELLVADEPVSALDVSVQAQILTILKVLKVRDGIAMLFISHDLSVVERIADRVMVMYRGKVMEEAPTASLIAKPQHPYTQALLSAVPFGRPGYRRPRISLKGDPPSATTQLEGCPFASRCPQALEPCHEKTPPLERKEGGHRVACHYVYGEEPGAEV